MTHTAPTPPDVKNRALRTAAQNLLFDALLAVILILLPVFTTEDLTAVDWGIVGMSVLKTVVVTVFAGVHRYLETHRAKE